MELNHLKEGMQPEIGELLYLKDKAPAMPRLASATARAELPQLPAMAGQPVASNNDGGSFAEHLVQPKETLYAIAKRYSVSIEDIMKWNDLQDANLKSGQALRIKK
jgi:hypothetical protein